ncbi:MAG: hypothetical protein Q8P27_03340 [Candidatus Peregrinibacteria bacterium]|nr:hypothetical protein [Candidatus Peregrinibacteria bacterium]
MYSSNFNQRTKIIAIAVSIFIISLSVGMLVFGTNHDLFDNLNTDSLHQGAETIKITP